MTYAKHYLILTDNKEIDLSSISVLGYTPIVRSLPVIEGNMKPLGICAMNIIGYLVIDSRRMPTLEEHLYIIARIRRIKNYEPTNW